MCVGDYRLGRLISVKATVFTDPQAPTVIAGANSDRVGITFASADNPNGFQFAARFDFGTRTLGMLMPDLATQHFTIIEYGKLVTAEFRAAANPNSVTLTVFEYFLPDEVLQDVIRRFASPYKQ